MIKSRRMRWAGHVARMGEMGWACGAVSPPRQGLGGETGGQETTGEI